MITLSFSVDKQVLTRTDDNTLASNSRQVHECDFTFSSEWDGMEKVATFKKRNMVYSVILNNDACNVPNEVLKSTKYDEFEVAVYATNGEMTITSTTLTIPVIGGSNTDGLPTEITPNMFEQIMGKILEIEQGEVSPEAVADAVNDYMEQHPIDAITEQECVNLIANYFLEHKAELKGDKGDTGAQGERGLRGATGLTPEITATAEAGASVGTPSVTVQRTGTDENPNLHFNFQNIKGENGTNGKSAYQIALDNGFVGTEQQWLASLKGEKGDKGDSGSGGSGTTPVISATATVDNTSGTPAVNVAKSGTDEAPSFAFSFTGLKGAKGDTGAQGIKGDSGIEPQTTVTDGTLTAFTLSPNILYVFANALTEMEFDFDTDIDNTIVNDYHFIFSSGSTEPTIDFPISVVFPSNFSIDANSTYEISIVNNLLSYQKWEN